VIDLRQKNFREGNSLAYRDTTKNTYLGGKCKV